MRHDVVVGGVIVAEQLHVAIRLKDQTHAALAAEIKNLYGARAGEPEFAVFVKRQASGTVVIFRISVVEVALKVKPNGDTADRVEAGTGIAGGDVDIAAYGQATDVGIETAVLDGKITGDGAIDNVHAGCVVIYSEVRQGAPDQDQPGFYPDGHFRRDGKVGVTNVKPI